MFSRKSDEQLIAQALEGSEGAWLQLVRRYEKRLFNHALRMVGNRDDAMDLLQDVLLSTYRNLSGFRGDAPFSAWIFRIATFRCTDHLRRKRLMTEDLIDAPDPGGNSNPEASLAQVQSNGDIVRLLQTLPNDQRQVVELKFFQNFTFEEIGGQLGISSNTAKTRLYSALKRMRNRKQAKAIAC